MHDHNQPSSRTLERYVGASLCMIVLGGMMLVDRMHLKAQIDDLQKNIVHLQGRVEKVDQDVNQGTFPPPPSAPQPNLRGRITELEERQVGNNLRSRFLADYTVKVQNRKLVITPLNPKSDMMRLSEALVVEREKSVYLPDIELSQTYTLSYDSYNPNTFRLRWGAWRGGEITFWYNKYNGWH